MTPEINLLLCCSTTKIEPLKAEEVQSLVQQELDWPKLIRLATSHGVKPLLYQNLSKICPEAVPPAILTQLQKDFRTNALRNLHLTKELLKILDIFTEHNIPALCFKGPTLAVSTYGDLSLRQFSDLDILIHERDLVKARDLMLNQGFQMRFHVIELTEKEEAAFIGSKNIHQFVRECAYEMENKQGNVLLEIHWEVIPKYFAFPLKPEYLWENSQTVTLLGTNVANLSPEDTLLLLCIHGAKDCWDKLNRVCDIAELVRTHPQLAWEKVLEQAKRQGSDRVLLHGLLLAHKLLGTSLPKLVWQKIKRDSTIGAIATQAQKWLFCKRQERPNGMQQSLFHLQIQPRWRDKLWYTFNLSVTPTPSDWALLPHANLPPVFYYLLRPLRIFRKQAVYKESPGQT
ncbi:MAG: nucleotidyltransferase family protein [Okeania sp. SIO2D1]|nr:nucleotidyltransferase family protein [Okeania sp. SIO2D1]